MEQPRRLLLYQVTLNPGESMSFTHPDGIALASGASISVDVTAMVTGDADVSNNTLSDYSVDGVAFWPTKAVVGERSNRYMVRMVPTRYGWDGIHGRDL